VTASSGRVTRERPARTSRVIVDQGYVAARRLCVTLLCNAVLVSSLAAQAGAGAIASLPGSVRAAGLGGAGAALVGDAGAVFSNPAGIATIRHLSVEGAYQRFPGGTAVGSGALALRAGRLSWGFGAAALDTSGALVRATDLLGLSSLVFRASFIALGTSVKYVRETLGATTADAWAGDVGVAIAIFDLMAFGASVQNLGGDLGGGARLTRRSRAGLTMNYVDPQGAYRLLTTLEGQWPSGGAGAAFLIAGVEGGVVVHGTGIVARVGYAGHSTSTDAAPFSYGAGVELGRLHVDYAYRASETGTGAGSSGGGTHRFGLRWTP